MAKSIHSAIVLGADLEGLAAAATLARAGVSVHLVDGAREPGGLSAAQEFHPGHVVPGLLHETGLLRRNLLASLELESCGLSWKPAAAPLHVLVEGQPALAIGSDSYSSALGEDAAAHANWRGFLDKIAPLVGDILDETPPQAEAPSTGELLRLGKKALRLRALGERDMLQLLRIAPLPAWDWMAENFENPALRAGLVAPILTGTRVGPRAAGTSALILLRECARGAEPEGGLAALTNALVRRCEQLGVEMHLGVQPRALCTEAGGFRALELVDGRSLEADALLSALDPQRTLLDLVDPGLLPKSVEHELLHWRSQGTTAVARLALGTAPVFEGCDRAPERFVTASAPLQLERAADALKYGELPAAPWLDVRVWSASEEGMAPAGKATLSVHVHGVPRALAEGWENGARPRLRGMILDVLQRHAPGLRESLLACEVLTPADLEQRFGLAGGHLYRGELALDQLWVQRPALALSRYETPIAGVYLGGAASHPGGPFACGAGVLAARAALGA